jgi:hypothetical protein
MNSRPRFCNLFLNKKHHSYRIIINNKKGKEKGIPIESLSLDIRIGYLGHELSHISAYTRMSDLQTLQFAFRYIFQADYKREVERQTDIVTIQHNLGYQLYAGVEYCRVYDGISASYSYYLATNTLTLQEILVIWKQTKISQTNSQALKPRTH